MKVISIFAFVAFVAGMPLETENENLSDPGVVAEEETRALPVEENNDQGEEKKFLPMLNNLSQLPGSLTQMGQGLPGMSGLSGLIPGMSGQQGLGGLPSIPGMSGLPNLPGMSGQQQGGLPNLPGLGSLSGFTQSLQQLPLLSQLGCKSNEDCRGGISVSLCLLNICVSALSSGTSCTSDSDCQVGPGGGAAACKHGTCYSASTSSAQALLSQLAQQPGQFGQQGQFGQYGQQLPFQQGHHGQYGQYNNYCSNGGTPVILQGSSNPTTCNAISPYGQYQQPQQQQQQQQYQPQQYQQQQYQQCPFGSSCDYQTGICCMPSTSSWYGGHQGGYNNPWQNPWQQQNNNPFSQWQYPGYNQGQGYNQWQYPGQQGQYPGQQGQYPGQQGQYHGQYPGHQGQYSGQQGQHPSQQGQYPYPGQSQYPGQQSQYLGQSPYYPGTNPYGYLQQQGRPQTVPGGKKKK